jgi:hypothetical protein
MANSSLLGAAPVVDVRLHNAGALTAVLENIDTMAAMVGITRLDEPLIDLECQAQFCGIPWARKR